ncbi:MAG: hypothetical protein QXV01_07545 [Candidatus Bathyarchaeia archaeon]
MTLLTVWQESEGRPESAYMADLENERLQMLGLEHAPSTQPPRNLKRLSEEYLES